MTAFGAPSASTGTSTTTGSSSTGTGTFTIGGAVTGLDLGKSVTLQNNSGDNLTVSAKGLFTFVTPLNNNSTYNVSVLIQPTGQTCTVLNSSGSINGSNVVSVYVVCQ